MVYSIVRDGKMGERDIVGYKYKYRYELDYI